MKPLDFPLLADENIHSDIVACLRGWGCDVISFVEQKEYALSDAEILSRAYRSGRVVLTHDSDFGGLAVLNTQPFTGIIYLRPGHIRAEFTIQSLEAIRRRALDVLPPFIMVAERHADNLKIRIRQL